MSRKVYPLRYFVLARIVCIYFMFCDFIVADLSTPRKVRIIMFDARKTF